MRKILLLITMILLTISCNHKPKEQTESPETKTLTAAEKRNQEIQDSLKQLKIDSLALIAWGDVNFGITMKDALATKTFKNGDTSQSNRILMELNRRLDLRETLGLSELWNFEAYFKDDELSQIYIESADLTANNIDRLLNDCAILIQEFTKKYGKPYFKKEKVSISEFKSGEAFDYAKFQIGDKSITIVLGELRLEVKFYYKIYIENDQFPKKKHVQTEKEKKEEERKRKEAEEIKRNSF